MLKRLSPLLFLAVAVFGTSLSGSAQVTFRQYTYVADSGGTNVPSITSPAITLLSGDFVYVFCRSNSGPTSITATSSPSNTFRKLTYQTNGSSLTEQASYATSVSAGPTTFTCTPSATSVGSQARGTRRGILENFQSMIVLDYSVVPTHVVLDKQTGGTNPGESTYTSSSFSTSSSGTELMIMCGTVASFNFAFTAGSIGSLTTTLRGVSASSLTGHADAGCEDAVASVSQSSITGSITYGSSNAWAATVGAFVLKAPPK